MTETLFLKVNEASTKNDIVDALKNEILYKKKCNIYDTYGEKIADFSKYDVLSEGIVFELNEPIQDSIPEIYKMAKSIELTSEAIIKKDKKTFCLLIFFY